MNNIWIWNWVEGGYNYCNALSKEEATIKAVELAKLTTLHLDPNTLHEGDYKELDHLDKMYGNFLD
ncbi:hypothetical protein C4577_02860 [Candidatus Parcubacteria bacterium]|nr:MAG: hypothetical protein C4577_02860 [Candidatus Parcubacteria bacterium]